MSESARLIYVALFWFVCAVWIFQDAKERKLKDPMLWAFAGMFFGVLGVFCYWYWVIRVNKQGS